MINGSKLNCEFGCCETRNDFDKILLSEIKCDLSLRKICHSNIGWFFDKTICESQIDEWGLGSKSGIYILWHKSDYCNVHNLYPMRALYVGKGNIRRRFKKHYENKDFSDAMIIYFSFIEISNRLSKYIEQLILDIYNIPYNKCENLGSKILYSFFDQGEVD